MAVSISRLDPEEVLRYMGCPPDRADPELREQVQQAIAQVLGQITPRWTWRPFGLSFEEEGVRLSCGLLLPGRDLKAHLEGCDRAVLFCATLGAQTDALIRRAQGGDLLRGLALDCAADAAVEELCDQAELEIRGRFPGCHFPFRYSPGYGDLPLTLQGELLDLLDAPRRVGLTASPSSILIPRKSVTALLGVSPHPVPARTRSCLDCPGRRTCQYRKSGGHCGIS